jgi:hypothetical protein
MQQNKAEMVENDSTVSSQQHQLIGGVQFYFLIWILILKSTFQNLADAQNFSPYINVLSSFISKF